MAEALTLHLDVLEVEVLTPTHSAGDTSERLAPHLRAVSQSASHEFKTLSFWRTLLNVRFELPFNGLCVEVARCERDWAQVRTVFSRAVNALPLADQSALWDEWVLFERCHGTLNQYKVRFYLYPRGIISVAR